MSRGGWSRCVVCVGGCFISWRGWAQAYSLVFCVALFLHRIRRFPARGRSVSGLSRIAHVSHSRRLRHSNRSSPARPAAVETSFERDGAPSRCGALLQLRRGSCLRPPAVSALMRTSPSPIRINFALFPRKSADDDVRGRSVRGLHTLLM